MNIQIGGVFITTRLSLFPSQLFLNELHLLTDTLGFIYVRNKACHVNKNQKPERRPPS